MLKRFLAPAALLLALLAPAAADQSTLSSPTTGTVSGLQLTNNYNNALNALNTCNSGNSAPANQLSGVPSKGNCWLDTSATPNLLKMYDGTSWLLIAYLDTTNHVWTPIVAGGTVNTVASAATTDLCSTQPAYVQVSGTTTITSFGSNCQVGQLKWITFTGALTLTHNATSLILPNNAGNITTVAGDAALAVYLGSGNWKVPFYTKLNGTALSSASTVTTHGDSDYTILSTDQNVVTSAALTLARTWTLPAASAFGAGKELKVCDAANGITSANTLTVARGGADTIVLQGTTVTSYILTNAGACTSLFSDGTSKWLVYAQRMVPQCSTFTSGSGATDTLPVGTTHIRVRMVGGGGGGAATSTNNGSNGADTSYGSWTAIHGNGGSVSSVGGNGGTGGADSTGTLITRVSGARGGSAAQANAAGSQTPGGLGGSSFFGGAGANQAGGAGLAATANSGSGGAGAGASGTAASSGAGGAGEFVEFIVPTPGATFTYTVGAQGNGGSAGGAAGGNGAAGRIERCAYFE